MRVGHPHERDGDISVSVPELAGVLSAAGSIDEYHLYLHRLCLVPVNSTSPDPNWSSNNIQPNGLLAPLFAHFVVGGLAFISSAIMTLASPCCSSSSLVYGLGTSPNLVNASIEPLQSRPAQAVFRPACGNRCRRRLCAPSHGEWVSFSWYSQRSDLSVACASPNGSRI